MTFEICPDSDKKSTMVWSSQLNVIFPFNKLLKCLFVKLFSKSWSVTFSNEQHQGRKLWLSRAYFQEPFEEWSASWKITLSAQLVCRHNLFKNLPLQTVKHKCACSICVLHSPFPFLATTSLFGVSSPLKERQPPPRGRGKVSTNTQLDDKMI